MLVLTLKKGSKVAIGTHVLEVITLYKKSAWIKYKGQTLQLLPDQPVQDNGTILIYKHTKGTQGRFAFSSPEEIWRLEDRERYADRYK